MTLTNIVEVWGSGDDNSTIEVHTYIDLCDDELHKIEDHYFELALKNGCCSLWDGNDEYYCGEKDEEKLSYDEARVFLIGESMEHGSYSDDGDYHIYIAKSRIYAKKDVIDRYR